MGARYKEMAIRTASPEQLVVLLYEGAIQHTRRARAFHEEGRLGPRGTSISRALAIVAELQHSLNLEVGGEVAQNLLSLYRFVMDRLLEANMANRPEALDEAVRVLETLHDAWAQVASGAVPKAAVG